MSKLLNSVRITNYSWVQKVVYGYEANLLISPLFEGQYILSSLMDFRVMGLI